MFTSYLTTCRRYHGPRVLAGCALALGVLAVLGGCQPGDTDPGAEVEMKTPKSAPDPTEEPASQRQLPKLLDLGATRCIPCKRMAPILDELREEYRGRMEVVLVDVWQNPDAAKPYGIEQIPTQIFFDASGKELARHTGFISKEEILKMWEELGVDLDK